MTLAKTTRLVACLSIGLLTGMSTAWSQSGSLNDQIKDHEQKLAEARSAKNYRNVVIELSYLGELYRQAGNTDKALDDYNQALAIEHNGGNRGSEALTENYIGRIYADLGQEEKALGLFNQALPVMRETGNRRGEGLTLWNIGRTYSLLAQEDKALDFLNQALKISRETNSINGQAGALDAIGKVYSDMSRGPESIDSLNQALALWRQEGSRAGEALTLWNIGRTYADMGQKQKSFEAYDKALAIWRELGIRQGEASTLNYLGRVYSDLGQKQTALDYLNQALPIWREVGNRNGLALDLNDIGRAHADLGQLQQALDFYSQALPIWREVGNRRGEAMTLSNSGKAYLDQGQLNRALEISFESLPVWREVKETRGEAMALSLIGAAYSQLGQPQTAFPYSLAALELAKSAGDPDMQGAIGTAMMIGFQKQHRPEIAIFFGLDAVNSYQQIRKNISGLDKDLQAGFAQSRTSTYRILAELLVETGRLGEAEQVLDLLKEQELKDGVRGAAPDAAAKVEPLRLSTAQQKAQSELDAQQQKVIALEELSLQHAALQAKPARTAAEDKQLKKLNADLTQGITTVFAYFTDTIFPELEGAPGAGHSNQLQAGEDSRQSYLQNTLAKLGPRVMGIRILMGQDHVYAIVVTATTRKKFELNATPVELRDKVFAVLENLAARTSDPKPCLRASRLPATPARCFRAAS